MSFSSNKMDLVVFRSFVIVILALMCNIQCTASKSPGDDLKITFSQKLVLDKFREIVVPHLPHDYMKENIYLIRWLRAQQFDLKRAEDMLMQNLKWRQENKMDTIRKEDWSDMETDYPYSSDGFDKHGQPVVTSSLGDWDLRRAFLTGNAPRILRYLDKIMEDATVKLRELQREGKNVTKTVLIENLDHFNLNQHLCPTCVATLIQFMQSYENHYPGYADKIVLINVPPMFEFILQVVRSTVRQETRDVLHVFGQNRQQWQKYLLDFIDKSQLTPEYGGTRDVSNSH